jgi:hypothetical protein
MVCSGIMDFIVSIPICQNTRTERLRRSPGLACQRSPGKSLGQLDCGGRLELDQGERNKQCQNSSMCTWIYTLELRLDLPHGDCRSVTIISAESILLFCIIQTLTVCTTSSKVHGTESQRPLPLRIVLELGFSSVRPNFLHIALLRCGLDISMHYRVDAIRFGWRVDFLGSCGRPLGGGVAPQFDSVTALQFSTLAISLWTQIIGSRTDMRTL